MPSAAPATSTAPPRSTRPTTSRESMGFVLGKRVGAPAGTTLVLRGHRPPGRGFEVGDDGRGRPLDRGAGRPDRPDRAPTARRSCCSPAAGVRPSRARCARRRRRARRAGPRLDGGHPVSWTPRARPPRPDRPHHARHRAAPSAGSGSTSPSSWPGAAAASCSPAAPPTGWPPPRPAIRARGARRDARPAGRRPGRPDLGAAGRGRGRPARAARTAWSTTPGSWRRPTPAPSTASSSSWPPTTSARSC